MTKKPLSQTNPYLLDPLLRKTLIERSVVSSCRVEGIDISLAEARKMTLKFNIKRRKNKHIFMSPSE